MGVDASDGGEDSARPFLGDETPAAERPERGPEAAGNSGGPICPELWAPRPPPEGEPPEAVGPGSHFTQTQGMPSTAKISVEGKVPNHAGPPESGVVTTQSSVNRKAQGQSQDQGRPVHERAGGFLPTRLSG